jgi:hypothetical protein
MSLRLVSSSFFYQFAIFGKSAVKLFLTGQALKRSRLPVLLWRAQFG